ncbi:MAG: hypothetical protein P8N72_01445 [Flavimaricola sp.]|nr:hypothetical protein [Flavimaricola sp.]
MNRAPLLSAAILALWAGVAPAQTLNGVVDLCSDPLTDGPTKVARLPGLGWDSAPVDPAVLNGLATAIILGFTSGMPDLEERFALAPQLADNFDQMINTGQISLWANGDAVLAVSIALTPEGTEHLACYYASPPSDDTLAQMERYGPPEVLPELELIAKRFDETAMAFNPDRNYQMYSTWSRLTSDPPRGPYTDAYRLERIEQPPAN